MLKDISTAGSRSKINYGVNTHIVYGPIKTDHYFDVINIDRYDAILALCSCVSTDSALILNLIKFEEEQTLLLLRKVETVTLWYNEWP